GIGVGRSLDCEGGGAGGSRQAFDQRGRQADRCEPVVLGDGDGRGVDDRTGRATPTLLVGGGRTIRTLPVVLVTLEVRAGCTRLALLVGAGRTVVTTAVRA